MKGLGTGECRAVWPARLLLGKRPRAFRGTSVICRAN